jgi:hypothetical protein
LAGWTIAGGWSCAVNELWSIIKPLSNCHHPLVRQSHFEIACILGTVPFMRLHNDVRVIHFQ